MKYATVAFDLLPYNMESAPLTIESNSKWRHCQHLPYCIVYAVCVLLPLVDIQFVARLASLCCHSKNLLRYYFFLSDNVFDWWWELK